MSALAFVNLSRWGQIKSEALSGDDKITAEEGVVGGECRRRILRLGNTRQYCGTSDTDVVDQY